MRDVRKEVWPEHLKSSEGKDDMQSLCGGVSALGESFFPCCNLPTNSLGTYEGSAMVPGAGV